VKRKSNGHVPNWNKIRQYVQERDKWCVLCGEKGEEIHHVVYKNDGGSDTPDNLVLLCKDCHKAIHDDAPNEAMRYKGIISEKQAKEYLQRYIKGELWGESHG
jgi:5-methylcytosine-specific restriction endonuclease McrA